ncbi:MAG: UvrB/UvrC motif-containing protein [Oscillospiraceae bacterium]|jgi:protein arginine kinase activator|nr:UvrB/UvrC motif-containing protein [Oscillospiraceae bacterium]
MVFIHSVPAQEVPPCPVCGITLSDISQTGRVGCPDCYRHFYGRLAPYIRRVHGPAAHTGRIPKSAGEHLYQKRRLTELQNALRDAVEKQEYEKCAELRDEINELSGKGEPS